MTRSPLCATTHWCIRSPGKTTFLKFMLARLIQAGQVVLLCDASRTHLFYKGQAYSRSTVPNFDNLPMHLKMPYYPIWALIDVDHKSTEPPISTTRSVWPIQTSSPNPTQWKSWRKQYGAALLGLPLWDTEELMQGCVLSLFSLSAIDPGHGVRQESVTDRPLSSPQFMSSARIQRLEKQTGEAPPAP